MQTMRSEQSQRGVTGSPKPLLTPAQIERLLQTRPVPPAYFTVPIKRVEEPAPAPAPSRLQKPSAVVSGIVGAAGILGAAIAAWILFGAQDPSAAAAEPAAAHAAAATQMASGPELPAVDLAALAAAIGELAAVEPAELETTAGDAQASAADWTRQRPGVLPVAEEPTLGVAFLPAPDPVRPAADPDLAQRLVRQGDNHLLHGDVVSARLLYERAAETGDAHAMLALAQTYDTPLLRKLGVRGMRSEPELAQRWYAKAAAARSQSPLTAEP
jgi:hypothetical protein